MQTYFNILLLIFISKINSKVGSTLCLLSIDKVNFYLTVKSQCECDERKHKPLSQKMNVTTEKVRKVGLK